MNKTTFVKTLIQCIDNQRQEVIAWHSGEPELSSLPQQNLFLPEIVRQEHLCNFKLWHVEDKARRKDVSDHVIAECKRTIDRLNQKRNDWIEQIDTWIVRHIAPILPPKAKRYHTETIGSILDRLSILSLKIYHMQEQTQRTDVNDQHVQKCAHKLAILEEQHQDLKQGLLELVDEYFQGIKKPKVYFQFKMYNDPSLNPELYKREK